MNFRIIAPFGMLSNSYPLPSMDEYSTRLRIPFGSLANRHNFSQLCIKLGLGKSAKPAPLPSARLPPRAPPASSACSIQRHKPPVARESLPSAWQMRDASCRLLNSVSDLCDSARRYLRIARGVSRCRSSRRFIESKMRSTARPTSFATTSKRSRSSA